jgi:cytochrome c oxidase subunit 2
MNELLRRLLFLPPQRSTVAREVDALHYFVISVTMAGSVLVFLVATILVVRYRRRGIEPDYVRPEAGSHRPAFFLELGVLVVLLALFLDWWAIGSGQFARIRIPPENALEIYVTGKQWMWKFTHSSGRRSIAQLVVPCRRPIKLVMTSRDVIHSFFVPAFRVKQDVLPGRYTTLWFEATDPGTYPILCAEYCGTSHSTMRGEVVVLEPNDYERWLDERPAPEPVASEPDVRPWVVGERPPATVLSLVDEGARAAADHGCLRCHTTDGSAHVGPTWAGLYGTDVPLARGGRVLADEAYLTESMMDPLAKIVRGYEPLMPSYFGRLPAPDTAAIVELIRSLRDVPRQGPGGRDPGPARLSNEVAR